MTTSLELLFTTAAIAVVSAVAALMLGYPVGAWLSSLGRSRRYVTGILLVPFLLPAFVVGLAFRSFLGEAVADTRIGFAAVIAAHALMNAGFIAVVTHASMVPSSQVEAAWLDGASRHQVSWHVQLPQQLPALGAAALLVALYSATSYGLVITLGQGSIRTLETDIVESALVRLDLQTAGVLAALQSVLTVSLFLMSRALGANPTTLFGDLGQATSGSRLGRVIGWGLLAAIAWVIGGIIQRAITTGPGFFGNLQNLAGRGARDVLNLSVLEAMGNSARNALIAVVVSLALAWWLSSKRVSLAVLIPIGLSPVVIGLVALVLSGYLPAWAAGSWVIVPLVQSVFLTPLAFQVIAPARRAVSTDLLEAARLDGATGLRLWGLVEVPALARPLSAAAALVTLGSLGEFGAASMLSYGSDATLPVVMFRLLSRPGAENLGMGMTSATVFVLIALAAVWLVATPHGDRNPR